MKEIGCLVPFEFRWSKLGPYSHELANIIERLTVESYLKYNGRYELNERNFRFIKPNITPKIGRFFNSLEKVCNENKLNEVDFIECTASLHFIYKYSRINRKEEAFKKLALLKPDRMPNFTPLINEAWDFLKGQDLVA